MKRFIKCLTAVILSLLIVSGSVLCLAAEGEKQYLDYGSYVLLGDSVASGWSDVEDRETRFVRVEGSYGAFVADDLGVDVYHPMACIGFRTVEMRYIFEDDFEPDRFLFYSISDEEMERRIPEIRKAVSQAGLITLNIGGNDWGSFLGWHVFEEMDKTAEKNEAFLAKAREYLESSGTDADTIDGLIDLASLCGALPDIIKVLPRALETGLKNFFENWNYMIEDIYALNPDVTLLVIGMFDNSVQDQETADKNEAALVKLSIGQAIVDFANTPMIEGAKKYGYTFIDTTGTVCEEHHPSREGHRYIADKILAALPDARFPFEDVAISDSYYDAVEYMYFNDIMKGTSLTEFSPDAHIKASELAEALTAITGNEDAYSFSDGEAKVSRFDMAATAMKTAIATSEGIMTIPKAIILFLRTLFGAGPMNIVAPITRAEAAVILLKTINL